MVTVIFSPLRLWSDDCIGDKMKITTRRWLYIYVTLSWYYTYLLTHIHEIGLSVDDYIYIYMLDFMEMNSIHRLLSRIQTYFRVICDSEITRSPRAFASSLTTCPETNSVLFNIHPSRVVLSRRQVPMNKNSSRVILFSFRLRMECQWAMKTERKKIRVKKYWQSENKMIPLPNHNPSPTKMSHS